MEIIPGPIPGWASDKYGRRPVLLIAIAGTTASTLMTGMANSYVIMCSGLACSDWRLQNRLEFANVQIYV